MWKALESYEIWEIFNNIYPSLGTTEYELFTII